MITNIIGRNIDSTSIKADLEINLQLNSENNIIVKPKKNKNILKQFCKFIIFGFNIIRELTKDRNTMYAKIFVKPTKAIEFIAIDFIITRAGASFDD